jgi:hypothetical protein
MFSSRLWGVIIACTFTLVSQLAQANFVANPGFESFTGAFASDGAADLTTASSTLTDWIVLINTAIITTPNNWDLTPSEGDNFVDLSGRSNVGFPKGISQSISGLAVGEEYVLSMDIGIRNGPNNSCGGSNCDGPVEVTASIGSTSQTFVHDSTDPGNVWSSYGFTFSASNPTMDLSITGISLPQGRIYIGLDNVSIAVPLPAAVWLFGSALGLLGWMRRKAT